MIERILLVDDELDVAGIEKEMLECLGYTVTAATSGHEAISHFRLDPSRYSLVITDYNMPDLDGLELTCQLKLLSPKTPVVLISGFLTLSGEAARQAGVDAALTKPLRLKELSNTVCRALGHDLSYLPH